MSRGFVYLDTSVALAHLLAEDEAPPDGLWSEPLVSSRLLEYELRVRINARGLRASHSPATEDLVRRVSMLELVDSVVGRAREAFPVRVRTLDALHLASMLFLRDQGAEVRLASYDTRLDSAARAVGIEPYPL